MTYWGERYGIPAGPWETFGGPAPDPPMQYRVERGPSYWSREWRTVADARTLQNILQQMNDGRNFYGYELRPCSLS